MSTPYSRDKAAGRRSPDPNRHEVATPPRSDVAIPPLRGHKGVADKQRPFLAMIYRRLRVVVGWLLIILGIPIVPLPIPFGAIMVVVGIALVAPSSPAMRAILRRVRKRFPSFNDQLKRWRNKFPAFIRDLIDQTCPDRPDPGNAPPPDDDTPPGPPARP